MQQKWKQVHYTVAVFITVLVVVSIGCRGTNLSFAIEKKDVPRISVAEARQHALTGRALMICAYEDERCRKLMLEGALLLSELKAQLPDIAKDKELIFYCA